MNEEPSSKQNPDGVDRWIRDFRRHKILRYVIFAGIIIVAIGAVVDALEKILKPLLSINIVQSRDGSMDLSCADFHGFPDDYQFGSNTRQNDIVFQEIGPNATLFVNQTGTTKGLQFPADGVEVMLPRTTSFVQVEIGEFAQPIELVVYSKDDQILGRRIIDRANNTQIVQIAGEDIIRMAATGGNNEGILTSVCFR